MPRSSARLRRFPAWLVLAAATPVLAQPAREPLTAPFDQSAEAAWQKKPVLRSRVVDDATEASRWVVSGPGALRPEPQAGAEMARLRTEVRWPGNATAPPAVTVTRRLAGEDWSAFNRLSVWIKPDYAGFPTLTFMISLRNEGADKVPDIYRREGTHHVMLPSGRWTRVLWEIAPLGRDKVTSLSIRPWVNKLLPAPHDRVAFEIGRVELERVEPDVFEGWLPAPGTLVFSHSGYHAGASKSAIARGLAATEFSVRDLDGRAVLTAPVAARSTRLGELQELDFSALRRSGTYTLRAGDAVSRPFRIDSGVWDGTIWKTLNFFYGERCGTAIPGVHQACHFDWQASQRDQRMVINGGWHDAGDLSQGCINTAEATYAMFALAEHLGRTGGDPALAARLIEEAKWGLEWVLKVRFPGGYRVGFASHNLWSNGVLGDADDRTRAALNNPNVNFLAATAEAIASVVLRESDPELARRCLRLAELDWEYAVEGKETPENLSTPAFAASEMELAAVGVLSSLELYRATGGARFAEKARELARVVLASQQTRAAGTDFPLAGFFYTGPDRKAIFHQFHRGNDQAPMVALARLCQTFPNHPEWMSWYAAVALHSEYQKAAAATTAPYGVLPAYVYHLDECRDVPEQGDRYEATPGACREQIRRGLPMGDGYYLKAFPVWYARRGNYGILLSQAKALSAAAQLRRDLAAADLAQRQAEWVVGRNPFGQSTMWGEGYDWAQQYSVSTGDFVGSLPVGMMTRGDADLPYWPAQNSYVYKEVWVHPSVRWLWMMQDLNGPAGVQGRAAPRATVEFEDLRGGEPSRFAADAAGRFSARLPGGRYRVRAGGWVQEIALLPGGSRKLDLRPAAALDFQLSAEEQDGEVRISVTARGAGAHRFELRAANLKLERGERSLKLRPGKPGGLSWRARRTDARTPWVIVAVPDGELEQARELVERR